MTLDVTVVLLLLISGLPYFMIFTVYLMSIFRAISASVAELYCYLASSFCENVPYVYFIYNEVLIKALETL